jgi:MtN3 and saliva related transmembrane protein
MTALAASATVVGVFLGLASLPQALKIFQMKSAKEISLSTYVITEIGATIWILYGLEIKSLPVIVPNVLGLFSSTVVLVGYFLYRNSKKK